MLPLETLSSFENPGGLSPTEIRKMMNHVTGSSIIDFSFRLLDHNLSPIGVPGGAASDAAELPKKFIQKASQEVNTNRPVHGQMTLELYEFEGLTYNSLYHRLAPHADYSVRLPSGVKRLLHIPLGLYMGILPARDLSEQVPKWSLTLYDETYRLQRKWRNNWVVPAGTNLVQEAITMLTLPTSASSRAGCEIIGPNIPSGRVRIPPDGTAAPYDITFTPDDTILQAVNDLLGACAIPYWPLREDARGNYVSSQIPINASSSPQAGWSFSDTRGVNPATGQGNIIKAPVRQSFSDQSELANIITVTAAPATGKAISATAENHDLRSAVSIENYEPVFKPVRDDSIASEADAYTRAQVELQLSAAQNDNLEWDHVVIPVTEPHDGQSVEVRSGIPMYTGEGANIKVNYVDGAVWAQGTYLGLSYTIDYTTRLQHSAAGVLVAI